MSEDASPTGGQRTPPKQDAAGDHNSSIIEKVRSRVSSIIPFSKWFSPTAGATTSSTCEDGSRNGGIRRRRDETVIRQRVREQQQDNLEDSELDDVEEEEDEVERAPPAKRSRLNVSEIHSPISSLEGPYTNVVSSFASSTPTTGINRRKQLDIQSIQQPVRSSNTTTKTMKRSTTVTRSVAELRPQNDDDGEADILEVIPEHRNVDYTFQGSWERSRFGSNYGRTSDIRELKLPARRPSLRGNGPSRAPPSAYSASISNTYYRNPNESEHQYEAQQDEDDDDEKKSDIVTNGVRVSPNMLSVDTASESGESQASAIQKSKIGEGLYGAGVKRFRGSAVGGINYASHLQGKKSLFGDKNMPSHLHNSTTSLTSLNRRQSFNASLYGSTSALSDSRLLNIYSPFYKGSTTYGGASAYSKNLYKSNLGNTAPAALVRPTSSLSTSSSASQVPENTSAISNTAKRILELMNQFTTPLSDAKKMASNIKIPALTAHRQRFGDADRSMNRGIRMATPKTPYSRPVRGQSGETDEPLGPPVNELHVPSMSQLLQLKKLHSSTERAREITRMNQSKCLANVQSNREKQQSYKLPSAHDSDKDINSSSKHVNKIKNKLSSTRSSAKAIDDAPVETVALPDIPLPLKDSAVPKINIDITKSIPKGDLSSNKINAGADAQLKEQSNGKMSSIANIGEKTTPKSSMTGLHFSSSVGNFSATTQQSSTGNNSASIPAAKKIENLSNGGQGFTFAAPIQVTPTNSLTTKENAGSGCIFKFSDPLVVPTSTKISNSVNNFTYQSDTNNTRMSIPSLVPKANTAAFVGPPAVATQLKTTGSVLDAFKTPTSVDSTSIKVSHSSASPMFGAQFKMSTDKWECSVCMVRNENSVNKCVSCTTPKSSPGSTEGTVSVEGSGKSPTTQSISQPVASVKSSFGDMFKPDSATWECPTCMIRNKGDLSKCEACCTEKPGSAKSSEVSSSSSLVPNKALDPGFKNIVAEQSAKWECSACMTHNESARTKCACCEQAKPGLVSDNVPQFSFGASTSSTKFTFGFGGKKEEELKSDVASSQKQPESNVNEKPKNSFVFGAKPAASTATPTASFSFGLKSTTNSTTTAAASSKSVSISDEVDKPSKSDSLKANSSNEKASDSADKTTAANTASTTLKFGIPISTASMSPAAFTLTSDKGATPAKSTVLTAATNSSTSSSSIFKSIGSVAFGANTEKKSEDASKPTKFLIKPVSTEASSAPKSTASGFSMFTSNTQQNDDKISSTKSSSNSSTNLFTFGSASASTTTTVDKNNPTTADKPTGLTFGTQSTTTASGFQSSLAQKSSTTSSLTSGTGTSAFVFGKPSAPATVTPTFGAISSNVITSSNIAGPVSTTAPSFSASSASSVTLTGTSSFQPVVTQALSSSTFGSSGSPAASKLFGSNTFSSPTGLSAATEIKPASGLFQFGAGTKPTESTSTTTAAPIFGNVSSTTSARFSFGSNTSATSQQSAPFVFGNSAKTEKPADSAPAPLIFGSAAVPAQNSITNPTLPAFGSFASPLQSQSQQSSLQQQPGQPSPFGQNSAPTLSSPFGAGLSSATPTFGSTPGAATAVNAFGSGNATFGASGASAFGSPATKTSLFGNGFGSTAAPTGDDPAAKKPATGFNFGAPAQNTTSGFAFGSNSINNNNNNNKQPFAFSASSAPSFNFTGAPETASNAPFQFNAAPTANNIFAPTATTGTSQTTQMRRKARIATRRTQQR